MLCITHQKTCPLYEECRYPHAHSHLFLRNNEPCSVNNQCQVEAAVTMESLLHTLDRAEQVERNAARWFLSWDCDCKRCKSGHRDLCYAKYGTNTELRTSFSERWRKKQLEETRKNTRSIPNTPLQRLLAEHLSDPLSPDKEFARKLKLLVDKMRKKTPV